MLACVAASSLDMQASVVVAAAAWKIISLGVSVPCGKLAGAVLKCYTIIVLLLSLLLLLLLISYIMYFVFV
jgi:hypothetical protein